MTLLKQCQENKLNSIALVAIARECAKKAGIETHGTLANLCAEADVNRTQVYEKKSQITAAMKDISLNSVGRQTALHKQNCQLSDIKLLRIENEVLSYQLEHPGSVVHHTDRVNYSPAFNRFILDTFDQAECTLADFALAAKIPYRTILDWQSEDKAPPPPKQPVPQPVWLAPPSDTAKMIAEDYMNWEGYTSDFIKHEAAKLSMRCNQIVRLLRIAGLISPRRPRKRRNRGGTRKLSPGAMVVTDGKNVIVELTSGKQKTFNWQGIIDQATTCHTAVVISETECAQAVLEAFKETVKTMGRAPLGLLHDNKPIYKDTALREEIERTTSMIETTEPPQLLEITANNSTLAPEASHDLAANFGVSSAKLRISDQDGAGNVSTVMVAATLGRAENKAGLEGEFGKFTQHFGNICLDDTNMDTLISSATREIIRAYTTGINHASRAELNGKSRIAALLQALPNERDKAFIMNLKAQHGDAHKPTPLPTKSVALALLDEGLEEYDLAIKNQIGKKKEWLAGTFEPIAIRQAMAIFRGKIAKGAIRNTSADAYLVKLIIACQEEIDLWREEDALKEYAKIERKAWLQSYEETLLELKAEAKDERELTFALSEHAAHGGIILERSFWEEQLRGELKNNPSLFSSVCNHVRRLYDVPWNSRLQLITRLTADMNNLGPVD